MVQMVRLTVAVVVVATRRSAALVALVAPES